jgi:RNA polymerase sigma-32 factor
MESRLNGQDQAFDLSDSNDEEGSFAPVQYLEDKSADVAVAVESENSQTHLKNKLYASLSLLDERSQDIISSRWLSEPKATLQDLACRYNVSAERVRQLEANAINKLKANISFE